MWPWDLLPVVVMACCLVGIGYGLIPRFYRRGSRKWITQLSAPIDAAMQEVVQRARGRRLACLSAGGFAGAGTGLILSAEFSEQGISSAGLQIAPIVIGLCSGLTLRAVNSVFTPDGGTVRVAGSTEPRLRDFIQPRAQILLKVAVPLATVVCVTMAVQPIWRGLDFTITGSGPLWVAAALIPFSCVLSYVLVRRLLRRPRPGESPRSYVWHNALRREMTVDLCMLPCVAVLLAALIVYSWIDNPWADLTYSSGLSLSAFAFYLAACHLPAAFVRLATSPTPALAAPS